MTRKKVQLAYITNDSARKATFKKRKKGLIKKVSELSTLCGINACAIIYSPYDAHPEIWPSPVGAQRVLSDFKMLPEMDQTKKMVNQESFIRQRISKASDHLKRQRKENREKNMTYIMFQCLIGKMGLLNLNLADLNDLGWFIDQHLKEISRRKKTLNVPEHGRSSEVGAVPVTLENAMTVNQGNDGNVPNQQQWFLDAINNNQGHMGTFGGEDVLFSYGGDGRNSNNNIGGNSNGSNNVNNNNTFVWSNNFFQ